MNSDNISAACLDPADLDDLLAAPADDPRHAHVRDCPRCRALVSEYASFLAADSKHPGLDAADAKARLDRFRSELFAEAPVVRRVVAPRRPSFFEALVATFSRPVPAVALLAAVSAIAWFAPRALTPGSREVVLRGGSTADAREQVIVSAPKSLSDGALVLEWRQVPEATGYEVRFYSVALEELKRIGPAPAISAIVPAADVRALRAAHGESVLCRIVALRNDEEIAHSRAFALPKP